MPYFSEINRTLQTIEMLNMNPHQPTSKHAGGVSAARWLRTRFERIRSLPTDEQGTISVMSVITIFALTIVLGMVINAGREVDDKVRLQNAADAATYSGGVVIARGLNALAFSNHVEAEIFALTAYFRAGRDAGPRRDPTTLNFENAILDAWNNVGVVFAKSSFPKFAALGPAIQQKVPLEKNLVKSFLEMTELQSSLVLSVFESILAEPSSQPQNGGAIPQFQHAVVMTTPQVAQQAASEIARMHGNMRSSGQLSGLEKQHGSQPLAAVLWRTNVMPVSMGSEQDPQQRTLPVFDPSPVGPDMTASVDYLELARCQRRIWAQHLLDLWNYSLLDPFSRGLLWGGPGGPGSLPYPLWGNTTAGSPNGAGGAGASKASALYWVWKIYTCGQLNQLLDVDYYATNLPYIYRVPNNAFVGQAQQCQRAPQVYDCACLTGEYVSLMAQNVDQSVLDQCHTFVGVAYWPRMSQTSPVFFRYPLTTDALAFAQVSVFIPKARYTCCPWQTQVGITQGGQPIMANNMDNNPPWWDITNQNWTAQLAPATSDSVVSILQSPQAQQFAPNVRTPSLGGLSPFSLRQINTH